MLWQDMRARLMTFQWERGARAAIAVGSSMVVCHLLGLPPIAAALGGFNTLLVDNGGPYRTRLVTMLTVQLAGTVALIIGCLVPQEIGITLGVTMLMCFAITFARVLSQPITSSSVLILVLYFAGLGGTTHTLAGALLSSELLLVGGAWAMVLSLSLWPVDPFRPARLAVAECYQSMAEFAVRLSTPANDMQNFAATFEWQRQRRARMEEARTALAGTTARAPSRTIRARNLTVLLETADLLLARTMRLTELADVARNSTVADGAAGSERLASLAVWLAGAEHAIDHALRDKPADGGSAFGRDGSIRMQFITRRRAEVATVDTSVAGSLLAHVVSEEREALLEMETAFDAVVAIWTGTEVRRAGLLVSVDPDTRPEWDWTWIDSHWRDNLQANWTMDSAALRHTLRVTIVGMVDVLVMRAIHVNHGFWLPMTSIILLQPFSAGTTRKSVQRVTGTVLGGFLAAILAAAIPSSEWMTPIITLLAALTVATFAVDYALYCFFLTPTFVLLSLPHPHDWRYAGIRIGTTLVGATISVVAMRLLWPERAEQELGRLLRRGAAADAAYLRATLRFWETPTIERRQAERQILAPARRACGLASNDAEEAVDRVMQEPQFGRLGAGELKLRNEVLTFATYLRRLTQSTTTLAVVGRSTPLTQSRLERVAGRMELIAAGQHASGWNDANETAGLALVNVAEEQMQRVERQVGILERAAAGLGG